jgi:transcription antitermination protein NusB
MIRRLARETALQFLFQYEFNSGDLKQSFERFWTYRKINEHTREFAERLITGVISNKEDLDAKLTGYSQNWTLNRLGIVDRNIIRLALYEMIYCSDIPVIVSINEAIDIAKKFSTEESGRFVNGVLDRAKKDLS